MISGTEITYGLFCFSGQSFHIENPVHEDPSLKYVVQNRDRRGESTSRASTSDDSEGSVEGTYNFAVEDGEIDERMFAGDRNSVHAVDLRLRYMDPAALNHAVPMSAEFSEGDAIRLENYQPRVSPVASRKNGTIIYTTVEVNRDGERSSEPTNTGKADLEHAYVNESMSALKKQRGNLNNLSKDSAGEAGSGPSSEDEDELPDWVPPPPPTQKHESPEYSKVDNDRKDRRTSPDNLVKGAAESATRGRSTAKPTSNEDSSEDDDVNNRLTVKGNEPQVYAQVDPSKKKKNRIASQETPEGARHGLLTNGSSTYDADTSEDDSMIWPPPPPPPQRLSNPPDDSDWERPLPPDIMALPGKRNRVAAWADDENENANEYENFTKI